MKHTELQHTARRGLRATRIFLLLLWIVMLVGSLTLTVFLITLFTGPPSQNLSSLDWAGYAVVSDFSNPQPVMVGVSGSWTVPSVSVSTQDAFSAAWIGIGGQLDDTLIQTGTEHDSISGEPEYSAWYELLPNDSVAITTINVSPGDVMNASINLLDSAADKWSVEIADVTNGQSFQGAFYYGSSRLSAEWIVERPTVDHNISILANFGSVTFTDASALVDTTTGAINDFPRSQFVMSDRLNRPLVSVSSLKASGSSFTVNYTAIATERQDLTQLESRIAPTLSTRRKLLGLHASTALPP